MIPFKNPESIEFLLGPRPRSPLEARISSLLEIHNSETDEGCSYCNSRSELSSWHLKPEKPKWQ